MLEPTSKMTAARPGSETMARSPSILRLMPKTSLPERGGFEGISL